MTRLLIMSLADLIVAGAGAYSVFVLDRDLRAFFHHHRVVRERLKEIRRKR